MPEQKPPTPVDTADASDPGLAAAAPVPEPGPAQQATRSVFRVTEVAQGISMTKVTPTVPLGAPGVDNRFTLGGNPALWR